MLSSLHPKKTAPCSCALLDKKSLHPKEAGNLPITPICRQSERSTLGGTWSRNPNKPICRPAPAPCPHPARIARTSGPSARTLTERSAAHAHTRTVRPDRLCCQGHDRFISPHAQQRYPRARRVLCRLLWGRSCVTGRPREGVLGACADGERARRLA
jgi:hypothetical protein